MIEKIPAPQAIPFDAKVQALGDISTGTGRPADPTAEIHPKPAPGTPKERNVLQPETLLTKEMFNEGQHRWKEGKTMRSEPTPLAEIALSEEEWQILADDPREFRSIYHGFLISEDERDEKYRKRNGLSAEQAAIIHKIYESFKAAANADGERDGLGTVNEQESQIFIGNFNPYDDPLGWHGDWSNNPAVRYVLAFGECMGTRFATVDVKRTDLYDGCGVPTDFAYKPEFVISQAEPGMATRFPGNYGLHCPPNRGGFRLFMTVTILPNGGSSL